MEFSIESFVKAGGWLVGGKKRKLILATHTKWSNDFYGDVDFSEALVMAKAPRAVVKKANLWEAGDL
jgi:hypothetical protein